MSSKVTITMPVYNVEGSIEQAIHSAIEQSHKNWELVIVDDASSDGSLEKAKAFEEKDARIRVLKNESNQGTYYCRNTAIQNSDGDFIVNLDGDDLHDPQKLKHQVRSLEGNAELQGCIHSYFRFDPKTQKKMLIKLGINTLMFRRSLLDQIGYYDSVRFNGDQEYLDRTLRVFGKKSIRNLMMPLQTCLVREGSLMNSEETKVGSEARDRYVAAYNKWHAETSSDGLKIDFPQTQRPFEF